MAKISVKFDTSKARKNISLIKAKTSRGVNQAIALAAIDTERIAKRLVPVDTGRLRSSIRVLRRQKDGLGVEVGTEVEYASKIEFGTNRTQAQPYLFPAFEIARNTLEQSLGRIL